MNEAGRLNKQVVGRLRESLARKYAQSPQPKPKLVKPKRKTYLQWSSDPANPNRDRRKTLAMIVVEVMYGQPIEKLLSLDKKGADIAANLGLTQACISKWRLRLGLRSTTESKGKGETETNE